MKLIVFDIVSSMNVILRCKAKKNCEWVRDWVKDKQVHRGASLLKSGKHAVKLWLISNIYMWKTI